MPMVQIGRCVEAQSLPWSVVQVVDDVVALGLRDQAHARALGQVLSHQAVEAFVALSFPRVVRRGEVDLHWEALFEQSVVMELGAVVEGDRLEQPAVLSERAGRRTRDLVLGARLELHHDRVSGLALHQRAHAVAQRRRKRHRALAARPSETQPQTTGTQFSRRNA